MCYECSWKSDNKMKVCVLCIACIGRMKNILITFLMVYVKVVYV